VQAVIDAFMQGSTGNVSIVCIRTLISATPDKLLDTYTGAAAAYSVRLLDKDYTGNCMRIREDSGDTETDIGFDSNGDLDTASIASHCGTANGYVVTWYDQSGNSNNATQSTAGSQPQIYNGTAVLTENGKPAVEFGNDLTDLTNFITPSTVSTYSVAGVARPDANDDGILNFTDGVEILSWHYGRTAGQLTVRTYDGVSISDASGSATISNQFLGFSTHNFDTPQSTLFINGNSTSGTATGRAYFDSTIGGGAGSRNLDGILQEIIIWASDQSSNRTGIESDINGYFSIYT
jgi:hypothetical protein